MSKVCVNTLCIQGGISRSVMSSSLMNLFENLESKKKCVKKLW